MKLPAVFGKVILFLLCVLQATQGRAAHAMGGEIFYNYLGGGDFEITLPLASRFSVWPLGTQHFLRSHGLEWPLDDVTMAFGKRTGTSNRVNGTPVSITAGAGDGYVVMAPFTAFDAMLDAAMLLTDLPA